jgi:hypothetical protein
VDYSPFSKNDPLAKVKQGGGGGEEGEGGERSPVMMMCNRALVLKEQAKHVYLRNVDLINELVADGHFSAQDAKLQTQEGSYVV